MRPAGWSEEDASWVRETPGGYRLMVQSVCTDVGEYSTEAELSGHGLSHARIWIGDTSAGAWTAAMWWCEGAAEVADWHSPRPDANTTMGLPV